MRVWIDLSNSPHPLLFSPIARRLEEAGHGVVVTARDNAQTVALARERWPAVEVIGGASPAGRRAKVRAMARRVRDLRRWARAMRPHVAVSHNSYGQIVAARSVGVPAVTAMDYEHQPANHLAFRLARTVLLPSALDLGAVRRQGASKHKVRFYDGLKEELYLADFSADPHVVERLGIDRGDSGKLAVARPEPSRAVYHAFENDLFVSCVRAVLSDPDANVVLLPRHPEQRRALNDLGLPRCFVATEAVDSRSLLMRADMMIGAGGTMTREAALLGVPTVSLFAGRRPAVDRWLERRGRMRVVRTLDELPAMARSTPDGRLTDLRRRGERLVGEFCDAITGAVDGARG